MSEHEEHVPLIFQAYMKWHCERCGKETRHLASKDEEATDQRDQLAAENERLHAELATLRSLSRQEVVAVGEKPPLNNADMLAYSEFDGWVVADFADGAWRYFASEELTVAASGITHWMPLPPPPQPLTAIAEE